MFGELALLDGAPRSATATALSAVETVVLPRDRFRELIANEPAVRDALLASLARRAPTADDPRRGAPFPRHHRAAGRVPRPAGQRRRDDAPRRRDPPADVADPGRPGLDGRQHPPEREQAPRPVRGRRLPAARARCDRPDRPRRPRAGVPRAESVAGASASSRIAAAVSAERLRPVGPSRKTSRRWRCDRPRASRRRPTLRVSPRRGRTRSASPTSAPPSSRAGRA